MIVTIFQATGKVQGSGRCGSTTGEQSTLDGRCYRLEKWVSYLTTGCVEKSRVILECVWLNVSFSSAKNASVYFINLLCFYLQPHGTECPSHQHTLPLLDPTTRLHLQHTHRPRGQSMGLYPMVHSLQHHQVSFVFPDLSISLITILWCIRVSFQNHWCMLKLELPNSVKEFLLSVFFSDDGVYMMDAPPPYPGIDPNLTPYPPPYAPAQPGYPPAQAPYPPMQAAAGYPPPQAPGYPPPQATAPYPPPQANGQPMDSAAGKGRLEWQTRIKLRMEKYLGLKVWKKNFCNRYR